METWRVICLLAVPMERPFSRPGSGFTVGYLQVSYKEVANTEEAFHPCFLVAEFRCLLFDISHIFAFDRV